MIEFEGNLFIVAIIIGIITWATFSSLNTLKLASKGDGCCSVVGEDEEQCGEHLVDTFVWWAQLIIGILCAVYVAGYIWQTIEDWMYGRGEERKIRTQNRQIRADNRKRDTANRNYEREQIQRQRAVDQLKLEQAKLKASTPTDLRAATARAMQSSAAESARREARVAEARAADTAGAERTKAYADGRRDQKAANIRDNAAERIAAAGRSFAAKRAAARSVAATPVLATVISPKDVKMTSKPPVAGDPARFNSGRQGKDRVQPGAAGLIRGKNQVQLPPVRTGPGVPVRPPEPGPSDAAFAEAYDNRNNFSPRDEEYVFGASKFGWW